MPSRRQLANAIRALSMDAVQAANSGHPGMPMGMADIAQVLWNNHLRHNPADPGWPDRDRFVVSNGHGSMLLYSLLHLSGYPLPMQELRDFRQLGSKTAGHPEYGDTPGVETTTGPLGQGLANAVGMAMAERALAAAFNRDGHRIVDHHTYVFLGDGCLMEGISHEVCSLAGTLGLGKLVCLYDDNGISIDGRVEGWFSEDVPKRFEAYGWQVIAAVDGHDADAVDSAITAAKDDSRRPSLICCKTAIGFGAPNKQGSASCHGAPLGADEVALAREQLQWHSPPFEIPAEIYNGWDARERGAQGQAQWTQRFEAFRAAHPQLATEFERRVSGRLPTDFKARAEEVMRQMHAAGNSVATRKASEMALEAFGPGLPELLGGSADLTGSNNTRWSGSSAISAGSAGGNYVHYGVREFGMTAMGNGIALHGGFIPYSGTFLVFSDYARNAVRMAALMGQRNILVYTHDSIGLGEDGPTHQAVEHTSSLRLLPNLDVWRPCDGVETAVAWASALQRTTGPSALLLSRQNLPHMERGEEALSNIERGGYVLMDCDGEPQLILIATGSEVELATDAAGQMAGSGKRVRVVSMPCCELFDRQDESYRNRVLPVTVRKRIAVEAGVSDYWRKYVGLDGGVLGLDRFGESAPYKKVYAHVGLTVEKLVELAGALSAG